MKYFDSHSHYYDDRFASEIPEGVDTLLPRLFSENVSYIINVGTCLETSLQAVCMAEKYPRMYTAIGIHPSDTRFIYYDSDRAVAEIEELILSSRSKCVALGEIGLDYHYPDTDREKQLEFFHLQMKLAEKLHLPVVIHDRDAHEDVMRVLRSYPGVRGVLHSFSGSCEMARELIDMGYMISLSGTVTFTNARKPKEVAACIPLDKLMIETDCPYLCPHPLRGQLNHSGNLSYTNEAIAEIRGITPEECALVTHENAMRFFGITEEDD